MIKRFLGLGRRNGDNPPGAEAAAGPETTYEEDKLVARDGSTAERSALARRQNVKPEILYFLAGDAVPEVRRAIANNIVTPPHANLLLAKDVDDDTRVELAKKIGRLLPDMPADESSRVREMTLQVIEVLARDQLPRIRAIVAEEIKQATNVPHGLVKRLAADLSSIVSTPVLEYSPLLSDDDLLEIIATGSAAERLSAIARRSNLSYNVSDAVVATLDGPAVATLLANKSAQVREETLDTIIEHAASMENWHKPLVMRAELSLRAMRRIAGFVAASLIDELVDRHKLGAGIAGELRDSVRNRLGAAQDNEAPSPGPERARKLFEAGKLDDEALVAAMDRNERDFVFAALTLKSKLDQQTVAKIMQSRVSRSVVALAWRAGFSMRTAMRLQLRVALIPPQQILNAKNGFDYPLSPAELENQLKLLGV